ncbi:hypothetical protein Tsubulata_007908 [Turnera subulata]|uniref:CRAL-TRIO domain-containing protein n=1 Tax=Turnera subulata TaxID=218843 RepID=A0A9Q0FPR6_9ROSI|nr:hypothetical protein Tsubulata_007908 [Turnera subulata]
MGDPAVNSSQGKKVYKNNIVASGPKPSHQNSCRKLSNGVDGAVIGKVAIFMLKVAALEAVRRVSRHKCPPLWRGLQALPFLCYPPFKWMQRWAPFKGLLQGIKMFSRPLLALSVATAFSDESINKTQALDDTGGSHAPSETHSETASVLSSSDARLSDDELRRFYAAADGDFPYFLLSIKKTIRWRETYRILSEQELDMWSNMVFWHGYDVVHRPCLIVRLGLACTNLPSHERPRFAQAVISQVERGILNLLDEDNPQITVLLDCDGISPLRIPMQMMKSCSSLLQDNFPNRLGHLLVIRLPPVVRVIAQTFIQVLKPVTRKKLRIEGKMYHRVLSEYLQTLPSYLGGDCICSICSNENFATTQHSPSTSEIISKTRPISFIQDREDLPSSHLTFEEDVQSNDNWDHLLRTAVIGLLMLWVFVALVAGFYDPASRPFFGSSQGE